MNTVSAFCTKCGAKMQSVAPAASVGGGAAAAPAPQQQQQPAGSGSSFLKIALITVGVIIVLVIGGITVAGFMIKKAVTSAVQTDGKSTTVNIGGLKLETLKDSKLVAEKMGVDVYPGATPEDSGAGSITVGGVTTTNAMFKTTASMDEVFDFYKAKYPDANASDTPEAKMIMQGTQDKELLTINIREENGETAILITHIVKGQ